MKTGRKMRFGPKCLNGTMALALVGMLVVAAWARVHGQDTANAPVPTEPKVGIVTGVPLQANYGGNLIVRSSASLESSIVGHVSNGDEVTIDHQEGSFYRITAPKSGYIWASYVRVTEERPKPKDKNVPWSQEEVVSSTKLPPQDTPPAAEAKKFQPAFDEGMKRDFEERRTP